MTKNEMIQSIEAAKELHQEQMDKIKAIIKGVDIENPTALGKMECECGQWFYANKDLMIKILGHQLFERLDKTHELWHKEYSRIYEIYTNYLQKKNGGLIARTLNQKIKGKDLDKLKLYFKELGEVTQELFKTADVAIRRVSALQEKKFEELDKLYPSAE